MILLLKSGIRPSTNVAGNWKGRGLPVVTRRQTPIITQICSQQSHQGALVCQVLIKMWLQIFAIFVVENLKPTIFLSIFHISSWANLVIFDKESSLADRGHSHRWMVSIRLDWFYFCHNYSSSVQSQRRNEQQYHIRPYESPIGRIGWFSFYWFGQLGQLV